MLPILHSQVGVILEDESSLIFNIDHKAISSLLFHRQKMNGPKKSMKPTKSKNTDRSLRCYNIARRLNKHTKSKIRGVVNIEDKPQMRCHHQLDSAAAKQIKRSGSILGLSHTYKNNTSQRLQRRTVDCCLEAGKLIASIAVRG